MAEPVEPTPESLLRLCAAAAPNPWFPKVYARTADVPRDSLDAPLTDLRMAGLVKLTDWDKDVGQGYLLTPFGEEVLRSPQMLAQLAKGLRPDSKPESDKPEPEPLPGPMTTFERGELVRDALLKPEKPSVTPVLIALNVLGFVITFVLAIRHGIDDVGTFLLQGNPIIVHEVGGLTATDLVRDEWWRLLACCFLHFGLLHLAVNMYALFVCGKLLEPLWTPPRYLVLYLLSGLGGSTAAMLFNPGPPEPVLAGASGAIWGLIASIPVWIGLNRQYLPPALIRAWLRNWWIVVLLNVAISFAPGVSAAAHFGGGAVGALVAIALHFHRFAGPGPLRAAMTATLTLLPIAFVAALGTAMERDSRWQRIIQREERVQRDKALRAFREGPAKVVAEAESLLQAAETAAAPPLSQPKDKRDPATVAAARQDVAKVPQKVQEALDKLGDREYAVPAAEKLRQAAREYMAAVKNRATVLDRALDPNGAAGDPSEEELRKSVAQVKEAQSKWSELLKRN